MKLMTITWSKPDECLPENGKDVLIKTRYSIYVVPYYNGFNRRGTSTDIENDSSDLTDSVLYWAYIPEPNDD